MSIILGFVPWIAFSVLSGPSTWEWAAPTAFVITLVLAVPDLRRTREIGVLDAGGAAFFGVLTVLALVLERGQLQWLEDRASLISGIAITLIAVGSLLVRRPFTEHYARQSTPREYWTSPLFRHVNVMITGVWALTFALQAVSAFIVSTTPRTSDVFGWVVPTLLLVAAVKFTMWYPDHATAEVRSGTPEAPRVAS
ncbi:hypothetical protein [Actinomycetospora termitidis]|uniref:Intracellular septation protein A n=1 Tax=Actinomycetospora termitidis TaxID=3053470 RepID=A0ABT7MFN8_9PSEU|nr:hypothetical protein [Actinomycetospora sp. Odt1-22]MDL5158787.1 hypothetical protein [Actinomycetospora sp. Odt1-22]